MGTDPACNLVLERVQLCTSGDDTFGAMTTELRSLGFDRTDRKYLVWVDSNVYCGIAGIWATTSPPPYIRTPPDASQAS